MTEMTKHGWSVLDRDAGILTNQYAFSKKGRANTFITRMDDGRLLVVSPPKGLPDGAFQDLAEFGEVAAVVANNGFHHLGQQDWRKRFPEARYFAAPAAQARIAKHAPDVGPFEPIEDLQPLLGENIGLSESPKTKAGETWAWAKGRDGYFWYGSDVFCNWDRFPGNFLINAMWRITRSGPGFRLFHLAMMATTKDKKALLTKLLEDVTNHDPAMIVPAHGPSIRFEGLAEKTRAMIEAEL